MEKKIISFCAGAGLLFTTGITPTVEAKAREVPSKVDGIIATRNTIIGINGKSTKPYETEQGFPKGLNPVGIAGLNGTPID